MRQSDSAPTIIIKSAKHDPRHPPPATALVRLTRGYPGIRRPGEGKDGARGAGKNTSVIIYVLIFIPAGRANCRWFEFKPSSVKFQHENYIFTKLCIVLIETICKDTYWKNPVIFVTKQKICMLMQKKYWTLSSGDSKLGLSWNFKVYEAIWFQ